MEYIEVSVDSSLVTVLTDFHPGDSGERKIDITSFIKDNSVTITLTPQSTQTINFTDATLNITTNVEPPPPPPPPPPEKGYTDITPDEAMLYLNPASCSYKPGAQLIDIRSEFERKQWGTPGDNGSGANQFLDQVNVHVPYEFRYYSNFIGIPSEITSKRRYNPDFLAEMRRRFKRDDVLILICRTGGRTSEAAGKLAALGFTNLYNVVHGIEDAGGWESSSLPMNFSPKTYYTFRCLSCSKGLATLLLD